MRNESIGGRGRGGLIPKAWSGSALKDFHCAQGTCQHVHKVSDSKAGCFRNVFLKLWDLKDEVTSLGEVRKIAMGVKMALLSMGRNVCYQLHLPHPLPCNPSAGSVAMQPGELLFGSNRTTPSREWQGVMYHTWRNWRILKQLWRHLIVWHKTLDSGLAIFLEVKV